MRRNLTAVKGLRSTLRVLNLSDDSTEKAGRIMAELHRGGQQIEIRDLFIGSICLEQGYAVLTQNLEHFKRIPELQVISEKELLDSLTVLIGKRARFRKPVSAEKLEELSENR